MNVVADLASRQLEPERFIAIVLTWLSALVYAQFFIAAIATRLTQSALEVLVTSAAFLVW